MVTFVIFKMTLHQKMIVYCLNETSCSLIVNMSPLCRFITRLFTTKSPTLFFNRFDSLCMQPPVKVGSLTKSLGKFPEMPLLRKQRVSLSRHHRALNSRYSVQIRPQVTATTRRLLLFPSLSRIAFLHRIPCLRGIVFVLLLPEPTRLVSPSGDEDPAA